MQKIIFFMLLEGCTIGGLAPAIYAQHAEWIDFPTVCTPNGDGNNDFFKAYGQGIMNFHLRIYNRQGVLCYETTSWQEAHTQGWNGYVNGQPAPAGVYLWTIEGTFASGHPLQDRRGKTHGSFYLQP